ncbi:peptide/nickel transport system ATP-binding protein/oligopeptide transport system ATP-binding protein [Neorhizobium galegae]|uniref:ABC transporter ATP-binding protein n=1 Tax=Neorhizobium galegae TaxID=399 RepID=UPI001AE22254|nr:ABC transporter ATP-binding protein [Neorhizobium galegae]MBP2549762.1 peptide/nickel transport system ATP-binding protein/oligopeptide transport system ATP-binding protein [Neorhizobium galegae]
MSETAAPPLASAPPLLEVTGLQTSFLAGEGQIIRAVDGVSFSVNGGETLAIVGESGSGKSVTSLSIMRLLPKKTGFVSAGDIRLRGKSLLDLSERQMRDVRGNDIGMIFQEPMTSLNPVHTIGRQIAEVVIQHQKLSKAQARARAIEMLELVGIPEPQRRADSYPHEMSGGMRQRAMIAMALSCEPSVLIADEPTTALDVTIQAQILDIMRNLQQKLGMAIVFITHDLGVVAEMADRVVVMYAGQVVETGSVRDIFAGPLMPYTAGLMQSIPRLGSTDRREKLQTIPGYVPPLTRLPSGCRFRTRCSFATDLCAAAEPELDMPEPGRAVRCVRWRELQLMTRKVS